MEQQQQAAPQPYPYMYPASAYPIQYPPQPYGAYPGYAPPVVHPAAATLPPGAYAVNALPHPYAVHAQPLPLPHGIAAPGYPPHGHGVAPPGAYYAHHYHQQHQYPVQEASPSVAMAPAGLQQPRDEPGDNRQQMQAMLGVGLGMNYHTVKGPMSNHPRRTEVPATRLRKVVEFIETTGRRPTRKSRDGNEKSLGIWLHRFTCNDDGVRLPSDLTRPAAHFISRPRRAFSRPPPSAPRVRACPPQVRDRAQAAVPGDEFCSMVSIIEGAPDSKQVADRAAALANLESIADRAKVLHTLPLRGDASGCGRKLHTIRQGRLGPSMREDALAIVRRVLGGQPENATVLAQLEADIEHSVQRHREALETAISRPGKRPNHSEYSGSEAAAFAAGVASVANGAALKPFGKCFPCIRHSEQARPNARG